MIDVSIEAQIAKLLISSSCAETSEHEDKRFQSFCISSKTWGPYLMVHCIKYVLLLLSHIRTKTNQDQSFSHAFSSWHMSRNVRMGKFSLFFQMWGNVFPNLLGAKKNWMFMVMREVGEWARILERFVTLMTPFADDNSINSNLCAPHTKIQHQKQN